jgi:putative PEP-CTERM system TPR-repeat lipoprotein
MRQAFVAGVLVLALLAGCARDVDPVTGVAQARALIEQGKSGEARVLLKNLLSKHSDASAARVLLARIALDEGNPQAASDELSTLDEAALRDPQALLMWARVEIEVGEPQVVLQRLLKSGDSIPQPDRALIVAAAYRANGSQADALAVLRKIESEVASSEALVLGIAGTLQEMGNIELATGELNKYLRTNPASSADALRMRGDLKLRQGKPADAVIDFEAALKAAPAAWPQTNRVSTELMIADAQIAAGQLDAAKVQIAKVEKKWPGTLGATVLLGQIALLEGRPEEAVDRLGAVEEAGASSARVQYLLVEALLKSGNVVRAGQLLETLVAKEPESSPSRRVLATLFLQQGRPDRVIEILGADEEPGVDDDVNVNDDLLSVARSARASAARRISTLTAELAAAPANNKVRAELAAAQLSNGEAADALATLGPYVEGRQDPQSIGTRISALYLIGNDIEANKVVDRLLSTPAGSDLEVLLAASDAAAQRQQKATVSRLLEKADALAPANTEVQLRQASMYFANKDYATTARVLNVVLQREPGNERVRLALARVSEAKGDVAGSRAALEAAVQAQPSAIEPALMLAGLELRAGKGKVASDVLDGLVAANPQAAAPNAAGVLLARIGRYEEARTRFRQAADREPGNAEYWYNLGEAQLGLKDNAAAKESFLRSAELQPDSLRSGFAAVRLSLEQKDVAAARKTAETLTRQLPNSPAAWLLLGDAQAAGNDLAAAGSSFARSYGLRPSALAAMREFSMRVSSAAQRPEEPLLKWLARKPDDLSVRRLLADFHLQRGDDAAAREQLEIMVKLAPNDVSSVNNLAWVLRTSAPQRAEALARQAATIAPDNAAVADTLGVILLGNDKVEEAARVLEKAAAGLPDNPAVQFHYASSLDRLGQKDKARAVLVKALKDHREFSERAAAQRLLEELG